jgi:uncharacterized protein (TIGR03083 family)
VSDPTTVLRALRASQQRLDEIVSRLDDADLERRTSDDGWSVAEVLGHLGSQSEIFMRFIDAGLRGAEPPSNESFGPIWDVWNAKTARSKASDALAADSALLDQVESLSEEHLGPFELQLFGMEVDAARLLSMRLGEHALHSWDIQVVFDDHAMLSPDAVELLVDGLGMLASRAGRAAAEPQSVGVVTTSPPRRFILHTGVVSLEPGEELPDAPSIELSSEALIRLVYGRLDDQHLGLPAPTTRGIELGGLRAVFPGV